MDLSDYLPMFLAEGREHLQSLNLSLVRLEQEPDGGETLNEIFRIAHSLKGMSATMGFERMAALTHEMESVMEGLRGGGGPLDPAVVGALFLCLDTLERMTDEIEADGGEATDPSGLVETLRALRLGSSAAPSTAGAAPDADVLRAHDDVGLAVVRLEVTLADDVDMPGVRAYLAARAAEEHGEIVLADPSLETVERGELEGTTLVLWLATGDEPAAVRVAVAAGDGIAGVSAVVCDVPRTEPEPVAETDAPEPEQADGPETARGRPTLAVLPGGAGEGGRSAAGGAESVAARRSPTVRVEADRLDTLMHLMGEMVVQRTRLEAIAAGAGVVELQQAVADLSRVSQSLQQMVMQVRMVPVESVFMRFPRMIRDLSTKLGKTVELQIHGEDTELDRTVVEALGDPLVHLVRNAVDHGLETPEERVAAGKPRAGRLELSAEHAGREVLIQVREDGRGIDPRRVGETAVKRGLLPADAVDGLSMPDAIELLFTPGFSTAAVTTDISGRGVGMDAVRTMVRGLGGDCSVTSEPGHGSCASIRLPLSLAILPALLVRCDGEPYALPLDRVEQTIRLSDHALRSVGGEHAIVLRDEILPLHDLSRLMAGAGVDASSSAAVVVRAGGRRVGLVVEALLGQQELVTRPLPPMTEPGRAGVSGGAVLGDGRIALIVDVDNVVSQARAA